MDSYAQVLRIRAAPGVDPAGLSVQLATLKDDALWAFTQRWDDNLIDSLRVRDLLNRRRMRGSFYLNASGNWYGNETRYPFTGDPAKELAPALLKGGHSIGAHTLSHNYVPAMARPEMFYETLANRIDREVNSQSPISSFVFPFTYFRNDLEGAVVHRDIAELLLRGGYLHVANQYFNTKLPEPTPLLDSWLLPCDGAPADEAVKALLASPRQQEREPVICVCMHAWPAQWGGRALPNLDRLLRRWKGRKHWWYPNANELTAYRWQQMHGAFDASVEREAIRVGIGRFEPWELGDAVPMTLVLSGAGPVSPTASLDGKAVAVKAGRRKGTWLLELPHGEGHSLPAAYEWHRNPGNQSIGLGSNPQGPLPGLSSRLYRDAQGLHLRLRSEQALESVRVRWRLPLGFDDPPAERLSRAKGLDLDLPLRRSGDALLHQGRFYAAAQIDALLDGRRIRLYSDVHSPAEAPDPSFPIHGFMTLGPLPGDRADFDLPRFQGILRRRSPLRPCEFPFKGVKACWESPKPERRETLHPEIVPAGGQQAPRTFYTWDPALFYPHGHKLSYMMAADVYSPVSRTVRAYYPRAAVKRLQVNGRRVGASRRLWLNEGLNRVFMLYSPGTADADGQGSFSILNYGPFFRLVGEDGERLTDIRYQPPAELAGKAP